MIDREANVRITIGMAGSEAAGAIEAILERMEAVHKGMDAIAAKLTSSPTDFDRIIPKAQQVADDRLLASQYRLAQAVEDLTTRMDKFQGGQPAPTSQTRTIGNEVKLPGVTTEGGSLAAGQMALHVSPLPLPVRVINFGDFKNQKSSDAIYQKVPDEARYKEAGTGGIADVVNAISSGFKSLFGAQKKHDGGMIHGAGEQPVMGLGGEFVLPRPVVQKHGSTINAMMKDHYEDGGGIVDEPQPFYSRLQRSIQVLGNKLIPTDAVMNRLQKVSKEGFSKEEWEWTGMADALAGKKEITRDELLGHYEANKIDVIEKMKGEAPEIAYPKWKLVHDPMVPEGSASWTARHPETDEVWGRSDNQHAVVARANSMWNNTTIPEQGSVYEQYTTPGGTNYREMLLMLPSKQISEEARLAEVAEINTRRQRGEITLDQADTFKEGLWKDSNKDYHHSHWSGKDEKNILAHVRMNDRIAPSYSQDQIADIEERLETLGHKSSAFGSGITQMGVLKGVITPKEAAQYSHYKGYANDLTGATEKILHVEEVQSDWHQQGREKGYRTPMRPEEIALKSQLEKESAVLTALRDETVRHDVQQIKDLRATGHSDDVIENAISISSAPRRSQANRLNEIRQQLRLLDREGAVPDAPFKEDWYALAMKHVLHHAAAGGYDRITLNPGEQINQILNSGEEEETSLIGQAKFYGSNLPAEHLGQIVSFTALDAIRQMGSSYGMLSKDVKLVTAQKALDSDKITKTEHDYLTGAKSKEEIGQGILDNPTLPKWLNKFGKQFGVQTEPFEMHTPSVLSGTMDQYEAAEKHRDFTATSLPIIDVMRKHILEKGLPQMAMGGVVGDHFADGRVVSKLRKLNSFNEDLPESWGQYIPKGAEGIGSGTEAKVYRVPGSREVYRAELSPHARKSQHAELGLSSAADRPNIEAVLQPLAQTILGNVVIEKLPFVETFDAYVEKRDIRNPNLQEQVEADLSARLARDGYKYGDFHEGNIGYSEKDKKWYILDPGALMKLDTKWDGPTGKRSSKVSSEVVWAHPVSDEKPSIFGSSKTMSGGVNSYSNGGIYGMTSFDQLPKYPSHLEDTGKMSREYAEQPTWQEKLIAKHGAGPVLATFGLSQALSYGATGALMSMGLPIPTFGLGPVAQLGMLKAYEKLKKRKHLDGGGIIDPEELRDKLPYSDAHKRRRGLMDLGGLTVSGYRVGDIDNKYKQGVYFAGERRGAEAYKSFHEGMEVEQYDIQLMNALLAGHQGDVTQKFFGKSYGEMMDHYRWKHGKKGASVAQGMFDARIAKELRKHKYDSVIYLDPALLAKTEVGVFRNLKNEITPRPRPFSGGGIFEEGPTELGVAPWQAFENGPVPNIADIFKEAIKWRDMPNQEAAKAREEWNARWNWHGDVKSNRTQNPQNILDAEYDPDSEATTAHHGRHFARGGIIPWDNGTTGGDDRPTDAVPGDRIMTVEQTSKHRPLLDAMMTGHYDHGGDIQQIYTTPGEYHVPAVIAAKNKSLLDMIAGNSGDPKHKSHFAGGGTVPNPFGMAGEIAAHPYVQIAIAGFRTLATAMETATAAMNIHGNSTLTLAQKQRQLLEELPVVGYFAAKFHDLVDALENVRGRILKSATEKEIELGRQGAVFARAASRQPLEFKQSELQAEAFGMRTQSLRPAQMFDPMTYRGRVQTQEQAITLAAEDTHIGAQRRLAAADESVRIQSERVNRVGGMSSRSDRYANETMRISRNVRAREERTGVRDQAGRAYADDRAEEALNHAVQNRNALLRDQEELQKRIMTQTERRNEAAKTELGIMQAQLQVLQVREQRMTSRADRVGQMSRGEYRAAQRAIDVIRHRGEGALERYSPDFIQRAGAIAPQFIQDMQTRLGQRRIQEEARRGTRIDEQERFDWRGGTAILGETRSEQNRLIDSIRQQSDQVAVQSSERIAEAFASTLTRFFEEFERRLRQEIQRVNQRISQQQNAQR